jgi:hypothetical protein
VYVLTPYGYVRDGKVLRPDTNEQQVLKGVHAWRSQGWSFAKIAGELNRQGVKTKTGGQRWDPSTVHSVLMER